MAKVEIPYAHPRVVLDNGRTYGAPFANETIVRSKTVEVRYQDGVIVTIPLSQVTIRGGEIYSAKVDVSEQPSYLTRLRSLFPPFRLS